MSPSHHTEALPLASVSLFSHLSPEQRGEIEKIALKRHYVSGEIVFYEGDASHFFHLLIEGEVSIFKSSTSNETIQIHRFRAPSLIAEVATLKSIPYPASCEATRPSVILKIERNPFLALLQNDPSLSIAIISSLTQKIGALEYALSRHSAPSALAKVARLIRDDRGIFKRLKGIEIARHIGITPETLSRTIKKLKTDGIISLSKSDGIILLLPDELNRSCG